MGRHEVCKDILERIKPVKNCVAIFEAHVERVIEELEEGIRYSPEAGNDPNNRTSHIRHMSASEQLYQDCSTYAHNREGTLDGELMRTLLDTYVESVRKSDKNDFDDVISYAREKGLNITVGIDGNGENVLWLYYK